MIYLTLFVRFFLTGLMAVGGGLATLPFLQEIGHDTGWFTSMDLANMIAVSESTPGPMGVNMATYVGFTTGGVAGLTTLEFESGVVNHDLKAAMDVFSPYLDEKGRVVPYWHHETWHDDNGSSHIKAALLSPFITVPFVNGKITVGPWQNLTLVECDTRDRVRDIVFQVMGE